MGMACWSTEEILLTAGESECCSLCQTRDSSLWQCISHFHLAASMAQEKRTCWILFQPFLSLFLSDQWVKSGRGYYPSPVDHLWKTTGRPTDMPFVLWNWLQRQASFLCIRKHDVTENTGAGFPSSPLSWLHRGFGSSLFTACFGCWVPPGGMVIQTWRVNTEPRWVTSKWGKAAGVCGELWWSGGSSYSAGTKSCHVETLTCITESPIFIFIF